MLYYDYVETVSKDTLKAEIDASEGFSQNQYTERSWNRFVTALENAKIVYENDQATKSKINSAYNELIDAREGLIEILAENQLHIASFNIAANRHPNIEAISQLGNMEMPFFQHIHYLTRVEDSYLGNLVWNKGLIQELNLKKMEKQLLFIRAI